MLIKGASILPVTFINNQILFLFGKERDDDDKPGWSDFGGGKEPQDNNFIDIATREGSEELMGFLGNQLQIKQLLYKHGTFIINYYSIYNYKKYIYRVHIFPIFFNPFFTFYFNNNSKFLLSNFDNNILRKYFFFEKTQIKWFNFKELFIMKNQFRKFYQNIIKLIFKYKKPITFFIKKSLFNNLKIYHFNQFKNTKKRNRQLFKKKQNKTFKK